MNNKSEKLVIGDIEITDGENSLEQAEKEAEKVEKETEKELEKSAKIVDKINNAKTVTPKFVDGSGKKLKLSEDVNEDIRDIPGLGKAYNKSGFNREDRDADYHNASYKEITPDEAYKLIKRGEAKNIRLLVDGKLVTLKDTGYGSTDYRDRYVDRDKEYVKKSGARVRDTAHMPVMHLLSKVADKIVYTDEASVKKDPNLLAARAQNPESPNYRGQHLNRHNRGNRWDRNAIRGENDDFHLTFKKGHNWSDRYYKERYNKYLQDLIDLKKQYKNNEISDEEYEDSYDDLMYDLKYYGSDKYDNVDNFARARYANSEFKLQDRLNKYTKLKTEVNDTLERVNTAKRQYDKAKEFGSSQTQSDREELQNYKNSLKDIMKKIAYLEFKLEDTAEQDEVETKQYKDAFDKVNNQYQTLKDELDTILRRK